MNELQISEHGNDADGDKADTHILSEEDNGHAGVPATAAALCPPDS